VVGDAREIVQIRAGRKVIEALSDFEEGATMEELAELLSLSKVSVHRQLKAAERDGHVKAMGMAESSKGRPAVRWGLSNRPGSESTSQLALLPSVPNYAN
jgi:predicted ArsR family transcriptional regulator